jgi:serine phosphatase RsbU (regulator of sigma subunit)
MSEERVEYEAFESAALRSESRRVIGLLAVLGALLLGVIAGNLAAGQLRLLYIQTLVLALAIGYEALTLVILRRAIQLKRRVPPATWLINVVIEAGLPTLALFILIESRLTYPYEALVAPAVFLYFIIIILSTLRLNPDLSILTGVVSAIGYLAAALYVHQLYPHQATQAATLPRSYFSYAGLILAGGIVAAVVSQQLQNHVYAALRKGELQRELDRVNRDLDIARSIQQDLLPKRSPSLCDYEVAGWNQPAEKTGGDYFDWQMLPDGRVAVSLGDATGHGIGPALVSASCRAYARASLLSGEPDGVLDNLNKLLAEDLPPNRFVTFAVVFLDPDRSCFEVLSAGHGPILWYRRAGDKIENIEAQGIPLGMIAAATYGKGTEASLASGDMLVLTTDGFYEWENPEGEEFGVSRLEAVIRDSRDCAAEEVIARLRSAVERFCRGTEQKDDLTALILKRKAERTSNGGSGNPSTGPFLKPSDA